MLLHFSINNSITTTVERKNTLHMALRFIIIYQKITRGQNTFQCSEIRSENNILIQKKRISLITVDQIKSYKSSFVHQNKISLLQKQ